MDSKILGMDSKRVCMDEQSNYSQGGQNNTIHHLLFPKKSWASKKMSCWRGWFRNMGHTDGLKLPN